MNEGILHCDMNGFYASVECKLNPALRDVPMAVSGDPRSRHGIILAKNEIAKKFGVVTAETIWQAKRKCPNLVLVPPSRGQYSHYSRLANEIYCRFTDRVEPFGIDESWLDVRGAYKLFGSGFEIAEKIRAIIKDELGLTVSVGVSFNKVFAKLGSDYKKPDATTLVSRENFKEILYGLPASSLLFVGKKTSQELRKLGILTIGDLAAADSGILTSKFGVHGTYLSLCARGEWKDEVAFFCSDNPAKSIGNSVTYPRDISGAVEFRQALLSLSEKVSGRLRSGGFVCKSVHIVIKDPQFNVITRQTSTPSPTNLADDLFETAYWLLTTSWDIDSPVRMLGISCSGLDAEENSQKQMSLLFDEEIELRKKRNMQKAIDECRSKFGSESIKRASVAFNSLKIDDLKIGSIFK